MNARMEKRFSKEKVCKYKEKAKGAWDKWKLWMGNEKKMGSKEKEKMKWMKVWGGRENKCRFWRESGKKWKKVLKKVHGEGRGNNVGFEGEKEKEGWVWKIKESW